MATMKVLGLSRKHDGATVRFDGDERELRINVYDGFDTQYLYVVRSEGDQLQLHVLTGAERVKFLNTGEL